MQLKDLQVGDVFRYTNEQSGALMRKTGSNAAEHIEGSTQYIGCDAFAASIGADLESVVRGTLESAAALALQALVFTDSENECCKKAIEALVAAGVKPPVPKLRYHHFLDDSTGRIRASLATLDGSGEWFGFVQYAVAVCSSKDVPSRSAGREQALKKLLQYSKRFLDPDTLARAISDRSIVETAPGGRKLRGKLRPPRPFEGRGQ